MKLPRLNLAAPSATLALMTLLFAACHERDTSAVATNRNAASGYTPGSLTGSTSSAAAHDSLIGAMLLSAADWNKGDLDGFMDSYDDSATMMTTHGLINKDTMTNHYRQTYFKGGVPEQQLTFDQFQITDLGQGVALLTGRFTLRGNNLPVLSGYYSLVCVYRKNGWKILHDHTS